LRALREGVTPDQREWAAVNLVAADWRSEPQVIESLTHAATKDFAPTVRVACIRSLARLGCNTVPVINALQTLKSDPDPRVQREAGLALDRLTGGQAK
jgi:hypothetical protein